MISNIETLKNLGPQCAKHFKEVGITEPEQIYDLGTEAAFEMLYIRFKGEIKFTSVYLYAIEGAILDCNWKEIPDERRTQLIDFFNELRGK